MRIAVLSDIHSNLRALDAVLASLGSVDRIWHLGDVVGYGPDPDAVVERLGQVHALGVMGNHDLVASGAEGLDWFNSDARRAAEWTRIHSTPQTRAYLAALPQERVEQTPAGEFTLVHGSPREPIWEYVDSPRVAEDNLAALKTPFCLVGHLHVPLAFRPRRPGDSRMEMRLAAPDGRIGLGGGPLILNPGGVGQPRDGDPRAAFLVIDTDSGEAVWRRVEYEVEATQRAMLQAGLPPALAARLRFGQ